MKGDCFFIRISIEQDIALKSDELSTGRGIFLDRFKIHKGVLLKKHRMSKLYIFVPKFKSISVNRTCIMLNKGFFVTLLIRMGRNASTVKRNPPNNDIHMAKILTGTILQRTMDLQGFCGVSYAKTFCNRHQRDSRHY